MGCIVANLANNARSLDIKLFLDLIKGEKLAATLSDLATLSDIRIVFSTILGGHVRKDSLVVSFLLGNFLEGSGIFHEHARGLGDIKILTKMIGSCKPMSLADHFHKFTLS